MLHLWRLVEEAIWVKVVGVLAKNAGQAVDRIRLAADRSLYVIVQRKSQALRGKAHLCRKEEVVEDGASCGDSTREVTCKESLTSSIF